MTFALHLESPACQRDLQEWSHHSCTSENTNFQSKQVIATGHPHWRRAFGKLFTATSTQFCTITVFQPQDPELQTQWLHHTALHCSHTPTALTHLLPQTSWLYLSGISWLHSTYFSSPFVSSAESQLAPEIRSRMLVLQNVAASHTFFLKESYLFFCFPSEQKTRS